MLEVEVDSVVVVVVVVVVAVAVTATESPQEHAKSDATTNWIRRLVFIGIRIREGAGWSWIGESGELEGAAANDFVFTWTLWSSTGDRLRRTSTLTRTDRAKTEFFTVGSPL